MNYNVKFPTTATAYGSIPQQIAVPPGRYTQASGTYAGMPGLTGAAGNYISSELAGILSGPELAALQDKNASWGVSTGMPMSGIGQNRWDSSRLLATTGRQQRGLSDYEQFLASLEAGMDDPALAANIARENALFASAPEPSTAAAQLKRDYYDSMNPQNIPYNALNGNLYGQNALQRSAPITPPVMSAGTIQSGVYQDQAWGNDRYNSNPPWFAATGTSTPPTNPNPNWSNWNQLGQAQPAYNPAEYFGMQPTSEGYYNSLEPFQDTPVNPYQDLIDWNLES